MFPEFSHGHQPTNSEDNLSAHSFGEGLRHQAEAVSPILEKLSAHVRERYAEVPNMQQRIEELWDRVVGQPGGDNHRIPRNSPERIMTFWLRERPIEYVAKALPFLLRQLPSDALQLLRVEPYCSAKVLEIKQTSDPDLYCRHLKHAAEVLQIPRRYVSEMHFPDVISYRVGVLVLAIAPRKQLGRDLMDLNRFINSPEKNTNTLGVRSVYDWYLERSGPLKGYLDSRW